MKKIYSIICLAFLWSMTSCDRDGYFENLGTISVTLPSLCVVAHTMETIDGVQTVVKQADATVRVYKVLPDGTHESAPAFTKTTDSNGYAKISNAEMGQIFPEKTSATLTESRGGKIYVEASKNQLTGNATTLNINMTDGETWVWVQVK